MPTKRRWGAGLLAAAFLALSFGIEYGGGHGPLPTWTQLYRWFGVEVAPGEAAALPAGTTTVTFLDVGQGDAVLIGQSGEYCLVDTGTAEAAEDLLYELRLAGVEELCLLVLTHPHADHIGGAEALMQAVPVRQLLIPDPAGGEEALRRWNAVLADALQKDTPVAWAEAGQKYAVGEGTLTVLQAGIAPPEGSGDDALNDGSLCFRFDAGGFGYLGTGDAEQGAEKALVDRYGSTLHADLLKAGHHGSSTSNSLELLRAVSPRAVVFSCGLENEYGHPHAEVVRRCEDLGLEQWRTDLDGTVTFTWDGERLTAYGTASGEWEGAA